MPDKRLWKIIVKLPEGHEEYFGCSDFGIKDGIATFMLPNGAIVSTKFDFFAIYEGLDRE